MALQKPQLTPRTDGKENLLLERLKLRSGYALPAFQSLQQPHPDHCAEPLQTVASATARGSLLYAKRGAPLDAI